MSSDLFDEGYPIPQQQQQQQQQYANHSRSSSNVSFSQIHGGLDSQCGTPGDHTILSRSSTVNTTPKQGNLNVVSNGIGEKFRNASVDFPRNLIPEPPDTVLPRSQTNSSTSSPYATRFSKNSRQGSAELGYRIEKDIDQQPTRSPSKKFASSVAAPQIQQPEISPLILKSPSKCPLFCCFYAEFDNKVGPKIFSESPEGFMEQNIGISIDRVEKILEKTFSRLRPKSAGNGRSDGDKDIDSENIKDTAKKDTIIDFSGMSSEATYNRTVSASGNSQPAQSTSNPTQREPPRERGVNRKISGNSTDSGGFFSARSKERQQYQQSGDQSDQSIFNSCSEYIITGHELTGNIVNLSSHNIHVLTRPTIIADTKYERNSLLFCVGFVLRRSEDPRPFRTVLSKLAILLRDMEVESQFLSKSKIHDLATTRKGIIDDASMKLENEEAKPTLQSLFEHILLSLNSVRCECNLVLNGRHENLSVGDNLLNLKLFHPPKLPAEPVKDHHVPILLRKDWQLQAYDWDLSINWVSLHIDGIINARQISKKAEVDMEMVRACLRVLRHHGVITLVDMFFYSNRYESTDRAAAIFSGNENKLLQEAVEFVIRRPGGMSASTTVNGASVLGGGDGNSPLLLSTSPVLNTGANSRVVFMDPHCGSLGYDGSAKDGSSCQPLTGSYRLHNLSMSHHSIHDLPYPSQWREDYHEVKMATVELYCACHRGISIGDLLISLVSSHGGRNPPRTLSETINWKKICRLIDHRRFTTFGLIHGLLKRVHNYPLAVDDDQQDMFSSLTQRDDEFENFSLMDCSSSSVYRHNSDPGYQYHNHQNQHHRSSSNYESLKEEDDQKHRFAEQVAQMMDGTHCDDELACAFELPLDRLFDLLKGKKRVVSVFAPC